MAKIKVEPKILVYLNKALSDFSLFQCDHDWPSCRVIFVDRENDILVTLGDNSYFYAGDWQRPQSLYLKIEKIIRYIPAFKSDYIRIPERFLTEEIIDSKKWAIPLTTVWKAYSVLHKIQKKISNNYYNRVERDNQKKTEAAAKYAETFPDVPQGNKKWWQMWKRE